ncbi:pYEATS domain-containing protein [Amycolatopsis sp. NPDC102389]|uniref:pYEATS domain-containing protein n=1 Tax=Amycolatopsis sp. NPDC102389 TaxID=3363941 RepID=UPI00381DF1C8
MPFHRRQSGKQTTRGADVMSDVTVSPGFAPLSWIERLVAGTVGLALLGVALLIAVSPPQKQVALGQCARADVGCVVTVDNDLAPFAGILAGVGAVASLIALLGVRFTRLKIAGAELGYEENTAGLPQAPPAGDEVDVPADEPVEQEHEEADPVEIEVQEGLGGRAPSVPISVTRLASPIAEVDSSFLRAYQSARKAGQRSHFLTHILGPAKQPGQKYSVAIRVTGHKVSAFEVKSASFYLGRSWGDRVFEGKRGSDGRFGIVTEAYGPFLVLCEIEFVDGSRILLDHYCDFDMGSLLPA